jgi:hypothetical protein
MSQDSWMSAISIHDSLFTPELEKRLVESIQLEVPGSKNLVVKATGRDDLFYIQNLLSWPPEISPNTNWVGSATYRDTVAFVRKYVWQEAKKVGKNKFVFYMTSEGYTFVQMKFWSDVFESIAITYLNGCQTIEFDRGMHFTQIWGCAPHTINMQYMTKIHKTYELMRGMAIINTNNFETLAAAEYQYGSDEEQASIRDLNSSPKVKPYKFLCYNNHPKLNRAYNVGQLVRRNLHNSGLISLNLGHDQPKEFRDAVFENQIEQFADKNNGETLAYFPKTGTDVFQALVNNKETVQSFKPLGRPRWDSTNDQKYDSYMALGEDTKKHCEQCYFAIVTETKYLQDRTTTFEHYTVPITPDTLYLDCITFTEKTHKFHLAKLPFVLFAMPGSLKVLRDQGYKTFSPYINEAYDLIKNDEDRAVAIVDEIERLTHLSDEIWVEMQEALIPILEFNFNLLVNTDRCSQHRFFVS